MASTVDNGATVEVANGVNGSNVKEVNGTAGVENQVQKLALELLEASKTLTQAEGPENLRLRHQITDNARQIINQIRDPGETPFEYSARVRNSLPSCSTLTE